MGNGRIFSRGGSRGFSQNFSRGDKSCEIWFLPLKIEETTFFANNFKIPSPLRTPVDLTMCCICKIDM